MTIGFDAKRIVRNKTGLGNYSRFVVNALSALYPENSYFLYSPDEGAGQLRKQVNTSGQVMYRYPAGTNRIFSSYWRSFGIAGDLAKDGVDIFHGLSNELPLNSQKNRIPFVVTIHDLIFLRHPELYRPADRLIYAYKFKQACLQSDRIIAVSEQTKRDIVSFFNIGEGKINVVYQGCGPGFYKDATSGEKQRVREKYNLSKPYILYVGSIEKRKNLLLLVEAFKDIKEDIHLIAIGRQKPYAKQVKAYIDENKLNDRVRILSDVPFGDLPAFYRMAEVFVYPSVFEGFGIPVLEALVSNTPVIAAKGSCLEEAGGKGSLYTDPQNAMELKGMIESVLRNPALADSMRKQGQEHARRFSADQAASEIMKVYQQLL